MLFVGSNGTVSYRDARQVAQLQRKGDFSGRASDGTQTRADFSGLGLDSAAGSSGSAGAAGGSGLENKRNHSSSSLASSHSQESSSTTPQAGARRVWTGSWVEGESPFFAEVTAPFPMLERFNVSSNLCRSSRSLC